MKNETDTPETDEMIESRLHRGMTLEFALKLCRKLERERNEARRTLDELIDHENES